MDTLHSRVQAASLGCHRVAWIKVSNVSNTLERLRRVMHLSYMVSIGAFIDRLDQRMLWVFISHQTPILSALSHRIGYRYFLMTRLSLAEDRSYFQHSLIMHDRRSTEPECMSLLIRNRSPGTTYKALRKPRRKYDSRGSRAVNRHRHNVIKKRNNSGNRSTVVSRCQIGQRTRNTWLPTENLRKMLRVWYPSKIYWHLQTSFFGIVRRRRQDFPTAEVPASGPDRISSLRSSSLCAVLVSDLKIILYSSKLLYGPLQLRYRYVG